MVTFAAAGFILALSLLELPPQLVPLDQGAQGGRFQTPTNIQIADDMKEMMTTLLARSGTLRQQCAKIGAAPHARIVVQMIGRQLGGLTRARATARRYDSGLLTVVIEVPAVSIADFAELLAHELEHVIELIDKVDLSGLMRQRAAGVTQTRDGVYETERAQAAGRAAAAGDLHGDGSRRRSHRPQRREGGAPCVARAERLRGRQHSLKTTFRRDRVGDILERSSLRSDIPDRSAREAAAAVESRQSLENARKTFAWCRCDPRGCRMARVLIRRRTNQERPQRMRGETEWRE